VKVAAEAGEGEIFKRVISFMLLDLERDNLLALAMQATVFTPVVGAFICEPAASGVHQDAP